MTACGRRSPRACRWPRTRRCRRPGGRRLTITLTNRQAANPVVRSYQAHAALVEVNRELQRADGAEPA